VTSSPVTLRAPSRGRDRRSSDRVRDVGRACLASLAPPRP
jgi:hypothetical protein